MKHDRYTIVSSVYGCHDIFDKERGRFVTTLHSRELAQAWIAKRTRGAPFEKAVDIAGKALRQFPKGPTGITPDAVKASPEYQQAKRNYALAFAALREFNAKWGMKNESGNGDRNK